MNGFIDVIYNAHVLDVHGQRASVRRREPRHDLRYVAQGKRERRRGISGENLSGKRFPSGELQHDVGEREEDTA